MRTVAYVAERLELPGTSYESVCKLNEKAAFRKLQHELGAFAPGYVLTSSFAEAVNQVKSLTFPVVLKPNYSSGSRGTTIIKDYDAFLNSGDAWQNCSDISLDDRVCIEEYVEMERLDGYVEQDIFVLGNRILWDGIDTCMRSSKLKKVAMTDVFPIIADEVQLTCIKNEINRLIRGADITYGEYNIEMYRLQDDKLFMIEINARQGGYGGSEMMQKHTGIDYNRLLVTTAAGDNSYFDEVYESASHGRLKKRFVCRQPVLPVKNGTFVDICISPEIRQFVTNVETVVPAGTSFDMDSVDANSVLGFVDLEFATRQQQLSYVYDIEKYIYPRLIENDE